MKWIEIRVTFESENKDLAIDLISEVFSQLGQQGVVIEDTDLSLKEGRVGDTRQDLPENDAVIGYLPDNERLCARMEALYKHLRDLERTLGIKTRVSYRDVDEEDWAESWKAFFWPEKVSNRVVIKPTWREYDPKPGEIIIEIDPGMAFGTGTHPTTRMCIMLIERYLKKGQDLLDIGTGSGILLIAAARLGAGRVTGVDNDEVAVDVARKNLLLNHIAPEISDVKQGDLVQGVRDKYDIIVANILSEVIIGLIPKVKKVLRKDAVFICSGIAEQNKKKVVEELGENGFYIIDTIIQDDWVAMVAGLRL